MYEISPIQSTLETNFAQTKNQDATKIHQFNLQMGEVSRDH
ncbi:hypothetical protein TUMEXPCC7403_17340 [Tumidithrix helvetica PCC 7403]